MAVEIPVVIDIDGAFKDAAARVPKAIQPLKQAMGGLSEDLKDYRGMLELFPVDSKEFQQAAKYIQAISQSLEVANDKFMKFSTNEGSIRRLNAELESLNRRWAEMGSAQKYTPSGALSDDAKKLKDDYIRVTQEIQKSAKSLSQMVQEEQRLDGLKKKGIQNRRYENAILNSTVKTTRILQEQERILSERLSKAVVGSNKYKQLAADLEKVRKELDSINGKKIESVSTSADKASVAMRQLTSYATHFVSIWSAVSFVRRIRETTAEFELQEVALGGILQNAEKAHSLFNQIKAAAVESPFFVKDLVTYTKQLSAYRIETDKLFDVTMRLADVSAGLGVDMNRLILAYGQVRAASVLRGQELRQFTEAGVPLVELLAEKFSELRGTMVSTADVFKLISERAVPFRMIEEIFNDMTSAGGMFYKMQEKQAKTLSGQWNNLKDSIAIALDEAGRTEEMRALFEAMIALAKTFVRFLPGAIKAVKDLGIAFLLTKGRALLLKTTGDKLVPMIVKLRVEAVKTIAVSKKGVNAMNNTSRAANLLWARMGALRKAALTTRAAFSALWTTILANPIGAVFGGLAIYDLLTNRVEQEVATTEEVIESTRRQKKNIDDLISSYGELSSKENLNERQSQKLKGVTEELVKTFRDKGVAIDENTGKLNINQEALAKLGEEEKKQTKKTLEDQKALEERYLKTNETRARWIKYFREHPDQYARIENAAQSIWQQNMEWAAVRGQNWAQQFSKSDWEDLKEVAEWINGGDLLTASVNVDRYIEASKKSIKGIDDEIAGVSTDAKDNLNGWQRAIVDVQDEYGKTHDAFTNITTDQLQNFSTLHDALMQFAKDWKESGKSMEASSDSLKELENRFEVLSSGPSMGIEAGGIFRAIRDIKKELELSQANKEFFEKIFALFGVNPEELLKKGTGGNAYTQPAYISAMNEQLKFMKDFEKGYRDLKKYLDSEGALSEELGIMGARGRALGLGTEEQSQAATDLVGWYQGVLEKTADEMRNKTGLKGSIDDLLSYQVTGSTNRDKMIRDFQKLLQSIFDAKTDINTTQLKKNIEDALKKVQEDIKRSATARDFFNDILEATGNEEIALQAAVSVYGTPGKDFRNRMQEEMWDELERLRNIVGESGASVIGDDLYYDLKSAITIFDIKRIRELFGGLPEEAKKSFKELLDEEEKFNADWVRNFYKTYTDARDFDERVATLEAQRARKILEAQGMGRSQADIDAINKYFDEEVAKVRLEELKSKYAWTKTFEDLEGVSSETLDSIIRLIDEYVEKYWSDLEPTQQKELIRARENAEAQKLERNALKGTWSAIKDVISATREKNKLEKDGKEKSEDHTKAADKQAKALLNLKNALDNVISGYEKLASSAKDLVSVFASDKDASYFGQQMDNISKTISGVAQTTVGLGKMLTGTATPQDYLNTITAISDVVVGIFSARNAAREREANERIEALGRSLDNLQRSYEDLDKAMAKSFGSDYIYNLQQQEQNLERQRKAYLEQARAEESKGKKADKDKVKEYEQAADDAAKQIANMKGKLAEFFTGTDVTSAAKDFAKAWMDAYREFASTTNAMKEKFQDMIEEMVTNSLAAQVMQSILQPWFDDIDKMAKSDNMLTPEEIAQIAGDTGKYVDLINGAMTNLMNQLGAAGLNMRQSVGQATGIKRDIASASEESINALTAGINTQNFYMSFVPTIGADVAAIREALTGESSVTPSSVNVSSSGFGDEVFRGQMMRIDENLIEIRALLKSVIAPRGTTVATHSVSVKL